MSEAMTFDEAMQYGETGALVDVPEVMRLLVEELNRLRPQPHDRLIRDLDHQRLLLEAIQSTQRACAALGLYLDG